MGDAFKISRKDMIKNNNVLERIFIKNTNKNFKKRLKLIKGTQIVSNLMQDKDETYNQYEKMSNTQHSINPSTMFLSESYIKKMNAEKCFMCMVYVKNCTNLRKKKRKNG